MPGERRADDRVGRRLAREIDAGAGGLQRSVRLLRAVERRLVLLPRGLHLRQPLLVLRLRDDLLIERAP